MLHETTGVSDRCCPLAGSRVLPRAPSVSLYAIGINPNPYFYTYPGSSWSEFRGGDFNLDEKLRVRLPLRAILAVV